MRIRSARARLRDATARLRPGAGQQPCLPCAQSTTLRPFAPGPRGVDLLTDDVVPRLQPGLRYTAVDGSVVLYDLARSRSHVLNPAAATVWAEIDGTRTLASLLDALAPHDEPGRPAIERQVKVILDRFIRGGVATIDPLPDATVVATTTETDAAEWAEPHPPDLDAIDWSARVGPVDVLGVAVTVRTNVADLGAPLRDAFASFLVSPPTERGTDHGATADSAAPATTVLSLLETPGGEVPRYRLYVNGRRRWSDDHPHQALAAVEVELTDVALGHSAGRVLLHAGAVERDGTVVAVAGDSGRGKSTLTAALVQRGWRYITDEITAVAPDSLHVAPYPKAIDLDGSAHRLLGLARPAGATSRYKTPLPIHRLGATSAGGRLGLIVLLTEQEANAGGELPTGPIRDLVDVITVTFAASLTDPTGLERLAGIAERVVVLRLGRAPIHDLVDRVEGAIAAVTTPLPRE